MKRSPFTLLSLLLTFWAFSQQPVGKVVGHVKAKSGAAIEFANASLWGTGFGAVTDATSYTRVSIMKDTRTNAIGYNFMDDHYFDTNGDLYISTCNSYYWGLNETTPSGILRVEAGQNIFDPTFFFNISSKVNNEFSNGLFHMGNGKAITRVFVKSITADDYDKYANGYSMETWIIDINDNSAEKLNIPLSKSPSVNFLRLPDGKIAIPSNTASGNFVYIYNPTDNSITKGLEYVGEDFREILQF